jgi:hypothetical protein
MEFNINGGWEIREGRTICRWLIVWKSINETIIAGALAGYQGGGAFMMEQFCAETEDGSLSSLKIDFEDKITGEEIDFFEDVPDEILMECDDAQDLILEWHDEGKWEDYEQLILVEDKASELKQDKDMLLLDKNHNPLIGIINEKAGITAAPALLKN